MSISSQNEGKKWINAGVAVVAILLAYITWTFLSQLGEWFELESKIKYFTAISQTFAGALGLGAFVFAVSNKKSSDFLEEVFGELMKVVWPDRNQTSRHTVGIMIAVAIIGFVFSMFDFGANKLLSLLH
ncbi:MAG: preprotein translocase subunit SecE [Bacteriovoracaceae bacterium]